MSLIVELVLSMIGAFTGIIYLGIGLVLYNESDDMGIVCFGFPKKYNRPLHVIITWPLIALLGRLYD